MTKADARILAGPLAAYYTAILLGDFLWNPTRIWVKLSLAAFALGVVPWLLGRFILRARATRPVN